MKPCRNILRKMGFFSGQEGIMSRYLREKTNWHAHLENTKNYILTHISCFDQKTLVVLGSGWWLDLPVKQLALTFERVVLVDLVHPREIILKSRLFSNVELLEDDISGGAVESAYSLAQQRTYAVPDISDAIHCEPLPYTADAGCVISLNILSQLHDPITAYLARLIGMNNSLFTNIKQKIQRHHLASLPAGRTILITDTYEIIHPHGAGEPSMHQLISVDLPVLSEPASWNWIFDTTGSYHPYSTTINHVISGLC